MNAIALESFTNRARWAAATVTASRLQKSYGDVHALRGVDLDVGPGEVVGLLGPNGAGKTTLIEILLGLRRADGGVARVLGVPVGPALKGVRHRMGVSTQQTSLPPLLHVRELVRLYAAFYPNAHDPNALIERIGLQDKATTQVRKLSGGQRQRLAVGLALVGKPDLVFLDEPTSELDPQARLAIWDLLIDPEQRARRTVLLSTHQMEEAERLCTRVAILDHGQILAIDTPTALIEKYCPDHRLMFRTTVGADIAIDGAQIEPDPATPGRVQVTVRGTDLGTILAKAMAVGQRRGFAMEDLRVKRGSLEDVFVKLTGRTMRS